MNITKCAFIKFTNKRISLFDFIHTMHDSPIPRVYDIKDLGVTFTSSFSFTKHINIVTAKSFRFLGFIKRSMKFFKDPTVLISLYNSYIRSKLEYCSTIWSPSARCLSDKIERVQKKFLNFVCFQCNLSTSMSYEEKCHYFNVQSLSSRRNVSEVVFVNKLFNGKIDCSAIIEDISFYIPSRHLRRRNMFFTHGRINLRKNSPLQKAQALDVFDNITSFKRKAQSYFCVP